MPAALNPSCSVNQLSDHLLSPLLLWETTVVTKCPRHPRHLVTTMLHTASIILLSNKLYPISRWQIGPVASTARAWFWTADGEGLSHTTHPPNP